MTQVALEELREAFAYDPETGQFFYRKNNRPNVNKAAIAGNVSGRGYVYLSYRNRGYLAHRVAFLIMEGNWPPNQVDHINGIKTDNRWSNLRHALPSQNQCNRARSCKSKSGVKGVYNTPEGRWKAEIRYERKVYRLGHFDRIEDAAAAYERAARELHREFARFEVRSQ
jgi:hypothetical protein